MPQTTQNLIEQYVSSIKDIYGKHIKQIILYGSYARGDFHNDSDIDIMVLVDLPDTQIEIYSDTLSELGFEYNVNHGIWFMPIVKNVQHFGQWCSVYPFYSNVIKEGLILYETA
ncbi:MAG: nucleotidyltransferase domain-containing protein [Lachnospiraceae bacterium]|nr:nucleotidyltransferase domain-containing protein [Lachnospiraceae bacterium]